MNSTIEVPVGQDNDESYLQSALARTAQQTLSEEEQKLAYARFFHQDIPQPDPEQMKIMGHPCDPAKAILPEQMNDLLNPGYLDVEIGWCVLPNGAGFVANRNLYPDVTPDMIDWWFAWHPLEDLRYRVWYPPQHAGIRISPEHRARLLDDSIPLRERNHGVIHHVIENTNCGMEKIAIHFMSPQEFGFDMARWKEPEVATFAGGQGFSVPATNADHATPAPALMCHIFRQTDAGLEHRSRFWLGYHFVDGKPQLALPPGIAIPETVVQGLARHNICEYTRFKTFLPEIYREMAGTW